MFHLVRMISQSPFLGSNAVRCHAARADGLGHEGYEEEEREERQNNLVFFVVFFFVLFVCFVTFVPSPWARAA
jgi:hypothetical protein